MSASFTRFAGGPDEAITMGDGSTEKYFPFD